MVQTLTETEIKEVNFKYKEGAHWKLVFFIFTGFKTFDFLNTLFSEILKNNGLSTKAMTDVFLVPHLVLTRNRSDQDESVNEALARLTELSLKCEIDTLFKEALATQERTQKAKAT